NGNVLVADTNNGRIEKFSPTGAFLSTIANKGSGRGQLGEPNGIAIDRAGNIYVAEVGSNHRVQKLAPDGTFIAEWKGPEPGFYGPRRIAIGPDDSVYVVDQGHTRIVKFSPDGHVLSSWGSKGSGDGQFNDPTSVAVDSTSGKDRKSTRLNSSHVSISYAVFCLKKKNKNIDIPFDMNIRTVNKSMNNKPIGPRLLNPTHAPLNILTHTAVSSHTHSFITNH